MDNELLALERFEKDVSNLLELIDYEYGLGALDDEVLSVPSTLFEAYRLAIVKSRGIPAIRCLADWGICRLANKWPDEACLRTFAASKHLEAGNERDTYDALQLAAVATAKLTNFADLTLTEAATAACLVSKLTSIADHVVAGISDELLVRTNTVVPTDEVWQLTRGNGDERNFLELVSRFLFIHWSEVRPPDRLTTDAIQRLIRPNYQDGDLAGAVAALWALRQDGYLRKHNQEIMHRVVLMTTMHDAAFQQIDIPRVQVAWN